MNSSWHWALDWTRRAVDRGSLPVAVLGVASSHGIEVLEAFGTDRERTATVDDYFALFSITKPLTALTAMRLVERGKLSLTTPLTDALPEFGKQRGDTVVLHHLLSHTAGLVEPALDKGELRKALIASPALHPAGAMVHYSNLAWDGVAALIEHASRRPFREAIDELATNADMPGLTFEADRQPHRIHGTREAGFDYAAMQRTRHPGAGLYSTATDLLALGRHLLRVEAGKLDPVLHPATLAAMKSNYTQGLPVLRENPGTDGQDYGLGWLIRHSAPDLLERRMYGHGGWSGTQFWIYPDYDLCFVFMTNVLDPQLRGVHLDQLNNAVIAGAGPYS